MWKIPNRQPRNTQGQAGPPWSPLIIFIFPQGDQWSPLVPPVGSPVPPPTQNHPPLREIREKGVFLGFFRVFSALSKHGKSLQDNKILSKVKKNFFNRFREVEMCDSPIFFGFFRILFLIFSATHNTHTKENA